MIHLHRSFWGMLAITLLVSCQHATPPPSDAADPNNGLIEVSRQQFEALGMKLQHPEQQQFDQVVKASGMIDVPPQNKAKITAFMGGYVKSTTLLVGDIVHQGQALVTLENTEYVDLQKDYLELAEQMDYLASEYQRQKTLFQEKIASEKNYLKAKSDYLRNKALYLGLKDKLRLLHLNPSEVEKGHFSSTVTLSAPIHGLISVMKANVGQYMAPADVILEIIDPHHLHLELAVFEKDILKVKKGQPIRFSVPEASQQVFPAEVHLVGKSIESADRTINVHAHLDENIKQQLLTGMFVEAQIVTGEQLLWALPKEALVEESDKKVLYCLTKTTPKAYYFKKIYWSNGAQNERFLSLDQSKGWNSQSQFLTKGAYQLQNL